MNTKANIILNHEKIEHILNRFAYQIYENNVDESEIVLAGIEKNGYLIAKTLKTILQEISGKTITLCSVDIIKSKPLHEINTSISAKEYTNKSVVIIDDVLHSGSTLIYTIKHFLNVPLKQLKTAVLVDRNHKKFPVKVDFKGISLSTSAQEHVDIIFKNNAFKAILK